MKAKSEYITLLRKYMAENASKYGIMRMGIFGSVARDEQTVESDVDVYVELQTPSMFSLVHIKEELQYLFGCAVDIVRLREDMDGILRLNIMLCIKKKHSSFDVFFICFFVAKETVYGRKRMLE